MFKIPLNSENSVLVLAPRWADLAPGWQIGLLALLLFVPLGIILWLSRYELRLISRRHAAGLLSLRLLILVVLWGVIGLRPSYEAVDVQETPTRVCVAVDLSTSMNYADPQRRPADKLRLARALKLHRGSTAPGDDVLAEWIRQYEAGKTTLDSITAEQKQWHDELFAAIDALSRKAIVARLLAPEGLNLLERLARRHQVEVVGFDTEAAILEPEALFKKLAPLVDKQDKRMTDLGTPLVDRSTRTEVRLVGIVLLSDGQHNRGASPFKQARTLGEQLLPIFPVVIGARQPPSDLIMLGRPSHAPAIRGDPFPLLVHCKVTNLPPQELTVEMQIGDKPVRPEHRKVVPHLGKDTVYPITFEVRMEKAGTHRLKFRAKSQEQSEITLDNNETVDFLRVLDDKVNVLLVDGEARWEYHYLANALLRDPKITLERVVFAQPRLGLVKEADLDKFGAPRMQLPPLKDEPGAGDPLRNFDCILLGDVAPEQLPPRDRRRLEQFVAERGGTLILMAGKRYLPLAYLTEKAIADGDPLAKLFPIFPVAKEQLLQPEAGFTLKLAPAGQRLPFMQLKPRYRETGEPDENEEKRHPFGQIEPKRQALVKPEPPKHFWGIAGKRKPAANVLLTPQFAGAPAGKDEPDAGIMLEQNYGRGRVMFVGIDSTWRWRYQIGDNYHHQFWGQMVRSSAERPLPAGNRFVRYGSFDPVYLEGQEVELGVRVQESLPPPKAPLHARAKLLRQRADKTEELIRVVPLLPRKGRENLLEAKRSDLPAGTYRMELDIPQYREQIALPADEKEGISTEGALFKILPRDSELHDLATNFPLMQTLAEQSHGKLYTPEDVEQVLDRLARRIERRETHETQQPWHDEPAVWWLLGLLLGLLTLEWGWRKAVDLP